ncbi:hypothetical protein CCUS01_11383 [Colletotrichum cuscutae]|uniref:Uncharacterized protein n=1 Tax=Colletotrichum cuscutae TaxID=1209917 RepID=A0AAI9XHZ9_9PEZI|nr:hypothetical protein CCUS01_11383 [Colletotrichum cuscutae]
MSLAETVQNWFHQLRTWAKLGSHLETSHGHSQPPNVSEQALQQNLTAGVPTASPDYAPQKPEAESNQIASTDTSTSKPDHHGIRVRAVDGIAPGYLLPGPEGFLLSMKPDHWMSPTSTECLHPIFGEATRALLRLKPDILTQEVLRSSKIIDLQLRMRAPSIPVDNCYELQACIRIACGDRKTVKRVERQLKKISWLSAEQRSRVPILVDFDSLLAATYLSSPSTEDQDTITRSVSARDLFFKVSPPIFSSSAFGLKLCASTSGEKKVRNQVSCIGGLVIIEGESREPQKEIVAFVTTAHGLVELLRNDDDVDEASVSSSESSNHASLEDEKNHEEENQRQTKAEYIDLDDAPNNQTANSTFKNIYRDSCEEFSLQIGSWTTIEPIFPIQFTETRWRGPSRNHKESAGSTDNDEIELLTADDSTCSADFALFSRRGFENMPDQYFAAQGASGSWVVKDGDFCGFIIMISRSESTALIMSAEDLFKSIQRVSWPPSTVRVASVLDLEIIRMRPWTENWAVGQCVRKHRLMEDSLGRVYQNVDRNMKDERRGRIVNNPAESPTQVVLIGPEAQGQHGMGRITFSRYCLEASQQSGTYRRRERGSHSRYGSIASNCGSAQPSSTAGGISRIELQLDWYYYVPVIFSNWGSAIGDETVTKARLRAAGLLSSITKPLFVVQDLRGNVDSVIHVEQLGAEETWLYEKCLEPQWCKLKIKDLDST